MSSLVMWDHFRLGDSRWGGPGKINGWFFCSEGVERASLSNPHGAPIRSCRAEEFCCDISDIGAIVNSKSRDLHFDSVHSFGRNFAEYKCATVTEEGLSDMLSHHEVKVTRKHQSDGFLLPIWDGRLFLCNDGGSHHLAAAAYISHELKTKVPVYGRLRVEWLDTDWWQWLLSRFRIAFAPPGSLLNQSDVAWLLGACYEIPLPWGICEGSLLLLPSESPIVDVLLDGLADHGIQEITMHLHSILEAQMQNLRTLKQRWPNELATANLHERGA